MYLILLLASIVGVAVASPTSPSLIRDKDGCLWFNSTVGPCNTTCGVGYRAYHRQFLGINQSEYYQGMTCSLYNGSAPDATTLEPKKFFDTYYSECTNSPCTIRCPKCSPTGTIPGPDGCQVTKGDDGTCVCLPGYGGPTCATTSTVCATNPCQNKGICQVVNDTATCKCTDGFGGKNCETDLCPANCQADQYLRCYRDTQGEFFCQCKQGFSGKKCEQSTTTATTCASNCTGRGTCQNTYGTPVCRCNPGSYGKDCQYVDGDAKLAPSCKVDDMSAVLECAISKPTGTDSCSVYKTYLDCAKTCKDMYSLWLEFPPVAVDTTSCVIDPKPTPSCDVKTYTQCLVEAKKQLHGAASGGAASFCQSSILLANCAAQAQCKDLLAMYCPANPNETCQSANGAKLPSDCTQIGAPSP